MLRKRFYIYGRVQGVGFRPAVYRLAGLLGLTGTVFNDTRGVTLELQGTDEKISEFITRLRSTDRPPLATIESCQEESIAVVKNEHGFSIQSSQDSGTALSQVTPDMGTCTQCLQEMNDKADFRFAYPFINCTNCGPRYSLVRLIPYDRPNTTMSVFPMCRTCAEQYADITDRRFHAQPVACAPHGRCRCGDRGPPPRLLRSPAAEVRLEGHDLLHSAPLSPLCGEYGVDGLGLADPHLRRRAHATSRSCRVLGSPRRQVAPRTGPTEGKLLAIR